MRVRRIFRPSLSARLAPYAAGSIAVVVAALLATAVPRDLFGSAPRPQAMVLRAGELRVIDGATLSQGDQVVRLHALQVPERGEATCRDGAAALRDCGAAAAAALARLVAGRDVQCRIAGHDRHGRALGDCSAEGVAVNRALVASGWALADVRQAPALAPAEQAARQDGRGLWAASPPPAQWRH